MYVHIHCIMIIHSIQFKESEKLQLFYRHNCFANTFGYITVIKTVYYTLSYKLLKHDIYQLITKSFSFSSNSEGKCLCIAVISLETLLQQVYNFYSVLQAKLYFKISSKDTRALIKPQTTPMAAEPKNMTRNRPAAENTASVLLVICTEGLAYSNTVLEDMQVDTWEVKAIKAQRGRRKSVLQGQICTLHVYHYTHI